VRSGFPVAHPDSGAPPDRIFEYAARCREDAIKLAGAMGDVTLVTSPHLKTSFPTDDEFKAEWTKDVRAGAGAQRYLVRVALRNVVNLCPMCKSKKAFIDRKKDYNDVRECPNKQYSQRAWTFLRSAIEH